MQVDCLVIGSGIAGLSYALRVAQSRKDIEIAIVTKALREESNTKYAQGGIAAVYNHQIDSFEQHVKDTVIAGDGLCDKEIVEMVIAQAPKRLQELIEWGAQFDENKEGTFHLGKEGGHSQRRILHHKDATGWEIKRALLSAVSKQKNIRVFEQHYAIDLITQHQSLTPEKNEKVTCFGAYVLDKKTQTVKNIISKITMLATGGAGQVYTTTTNPTIATGDGIGMAYRAKATIRGMEFVQFHPTALYQNPQESPAFLISEAVRGFGGKLKDTAGNSFMKRFDPREEMASRDIVARAIDTVLKENGDPCVFLDCTQTDVQSFITHFPNIFKKCQKIGIDIRKQGIPVVPATHYICGGIVVNNSGQSTIENLFVCGECAQTGLHGANRLASNSLLEALVYSYNGYEKTMEIIDGITFNDTIKKWDSSNTFVNKEDILVKRVRSEVQEIMSNYVGIVRSNRRLQNAYKRLLIIYEETEDLFKSTHLSAEICELRNLITTGFLICKHSLERKENRGGFFNRDI